MFVLHCFQALERPERPLLSPSGLIVVVHSAPTLGGVEVGGRGGVRASRGTVEEEGLPARLTAGCGSGTKTCLLQRQCLLKRSCPQQIRNELFGCEPVGGSGGCMSPAQLIIFQVAVELWTEVVHHKCPNI